MDEVVETYLPSNKKINKFFLLTDKQKVQVVELGLSLFEHGCNKIQYMNNAEWESKIESLKELHKKEKMHLEENYYEIEERWKNFIKKSGKEKELLINDIKINEKMKFNQEISHIKEENLQIKDENTEIRNKLSKLTADFHHIHTTIDNKFNERMRQKEGDWKKEISAERKRTDDQRAEYEDKMQKIQQKYENMMFRTQNSAIKGQDGEDYVFNQLNLLFPKAEIENTSKIDGRGDFIMREKEFVMMIENKNYSINVKKSEVDKFYRDVESPANKDVQCAVLISLNTGICNKKDFQLEIRNGKPVLFLHRVQNNMQKLILAVKFFNLIKCQKDLDLSNKEIIGNFKNFASSIKRNYNKQRNKLDKYYSDQMELIVGQETQIMELYKLVNIKY